MKARHIYSGFSVDSTNAFDEYQDIFPPLYDMNLLACLNMNDCDKITTTQSFLGKLGRVSDISSHPVHIINSNGDRNPSALIPFCRIGNKIIGDKIDEFLIPVCTGFKPKVLEGNLCYSLDLNNVGDDIVFGNEKDYALTLYIDSNQERNLGGLNKSLLQLDQELQDSGRRFMFGNKRGSGLKLGEATLHIDSFYPYTSNGGGPYEMSSVKQIQTSSDFHTIGQDKMLCQLEETRRECSDRMLLTGAIDSCGCVPWHLVQHTKHVHNESLTACSPITASCFYSYIMENKDDVKSNCPQNCCGFHVDVFNVNKKSTKVVMRSKEGPYDRDHLKVFDNYRLYKRNWWNISFYDSMLGKLTQVVTGFNSNSSFI